MDFLFAPGGLASWRGGGGPGQGEEPHRVDVLLLDLLVAALRRHAPQLELDVGGSQELHGSPGECRLCIVVTF